MKILIVEDEAIVAESLASSLRKLGYQVSNIAHSYSEAIEALEKQVPDLALIDIMLGGFKDGVDLGAHLRERHNFPFLYLTSYSDKTTVERAKATRPNGFLLKPFEQRDIYTAIEIALSNFVGTEEKTDVKVEEPNNEAPDRFVISDGMFVKVGHAYKKVGFADILWLKADSNYTSIFVGENTKYVVRGYLKDLEEMLPESAFYRIHKSYLINLKAVEAIEPTCVRIAGSEIPLGKSFRDQFMNRIRKL